MPIYSIDNCYISYAIGTDLTAWDNVYAVLLLAELQSVDKLDVTANQVSVDYSDPIIEEVGHMSTAQYPVQISTGYKEAAIAIPNFLQTGVWAYATLGKCATTRTGAEVTTVECVTKALCVENSTFHFWVVDAAGAVTEYYVWINKGTGADPTESGTAIEADISGATTAIDVAEVIDNLIDAKANVGAENAGTATITITNAQNGAVEDCCSSEGTDTGFTIIITTQGTSTHAITLLTTSQTPISLALHLEKELTTEDLRYDFFGFMPDYWRVFCGDDSARWKARQVLGAKFACSDGTAGDVAEPTKQALSIYEWNDLKHASGLFQFQYNTDDLEFKAHGFDFTFRRTKPLWGVKNSSGFPSEAFISGAYIDLYVDGYVEGNNIRTIMATKPEDYAGALDVDIKFYKSATREFYINLDNLYLVPDKDILNEKSWYEKKTLHFIPLDHTTACAITPKDSLDKTYYEND